MLRATLRSLLARRLRLMLSGLAVVIGVAFVSGTYVLTDTINATFNNIFTEANAHVSVAVQGASSVSGQGGTEERNTVPERALEVVRSVPGVSDAHGLVQGVAQLIGSNGKAVKTNAPLGTSWTNDPVLSPLTLLVRPVRPVGPDQIAIDQKTAEDNNLQWAIGCGSSPSPRPASTRSPASSASAMPTRWRGPPSQPSTSRPPSGSSTCPGQFSSVYRRRRPQRLRHRARRAGAGRAG